MVLGKQGRLVRVYTFLRQYRLCFRNLASSVPIRIGTTFAKSGLLGVSQTLMIALCAAARFCKTLSPFLLAFLHLLTAYLRNVIIQLTIGKLRVGGVL